MISATSQAWLTFQAASDTGLGDGVWITNTATLIDGAGIMHSLQAAAQIDALPPVSAVLIPAPGQVLTTTILLVQGNASDHVSNLSQVMLSLDNAEWQEAAGLEIWSLQLSNLSQGAHNIRSRAADAAGWIEIPSAGVTFTVDSIQPQLTGFEPISGSHDITTSLILTFSESMRTDTLVFQVSPDPGGWEVRWNGSGTVATLTHIAFSSGQEYQFQLIYAYDLAGNPVLPAVKWFSTWHQVYSPLIWRE